MQETGLVPLFYHNSIELFDVTPERSQRRRQRELKNPMELRSLLILSRVGLAKGRITAARFP
jgi:hypothetical protein